jgi:hypothetical protein
MTHSLLRSQVNALIKSLLGAGMGLDVLDFKEETLQGKLAVSLPLKSSTKDGSLYFEIDYGRYGTEPQYRVKCLPGRSPAGTILYYNQWNSVQNDFDGWAKKVRDELAEPDPWLLVTQGSLLSGDIPRGQEGESAFSEGDLKIVRQSLEDIREFLVSEARPNLDQLRMIDERLGYLEDCAKTQDKKAWAYTAVGVVFTIGASLSLSPDQGHKLFMLTSEMIRAILLKLLA